MVLLACGIAGAAGQGDEVREHVWQLARDLRNPFSIIRSELARWMAEDKRTPKAILKPLSDVVGEVMADLATFDIDVLRGLAQLGKRIDARLHAPQDAKWDRRLGDSLAIWVASRPGNMAKSLGAQQAAAAYARAGNEVKAMEMREFSRAAIQSQETFTIELPFENVEETITNLRSALREVFDEAGADDVISMLAIGAHIIPSVDEIEKLEAKMQRNGSGSFMSMISSHKIAGVRIVDHTAPGTEQSRRSFVQTYDISVTTDSRMMMSSFVQELVLSEEINLEDLMAFLARSWLGRRPRENPEIEDSLIALLRPGIRAWIEASAADRPSDDLILVGDSLTPKIETALRKMASRVGSAEVKSIDRAGKTVDEYRGLEIADDACIQAVLGEDLAEFLRYVLDSDGEGFRDRLAHGATLPSEYRFENIDLIILLLLRLADRNVADFAGEKQDATSGKIVKQT